MTGTEELAQSLLKQLYTASELKHVSVALETLSQSSTFKNQAQRIATDEKLTHALKKKQLTALIKDIGIPKLIAFFDDLLEKKEYWIFDNKEIDYFDQFSQSFQMQTENIQIVHIVTAVELKPSDKAQFAKELSKAFEKQVMLHCQVNEKILGGAQIRLGNLVYDYTVKSKFLQFQRQWISQLNKTSKMVGRE